MYVRARELTPQYIALQNDERGQGPLEKYFYGETMHGAGAGIFKANMYLAEGETSSTMDPTDCPDRILCWELVSKRGSKWLLHYVKSSYATTDVPDAVPELVSQRRRWVVDIRSEPDSPDGSTVPSSLRFTRLFTLVTFTAPRMLLLQVGPDTPRHNFGRKFLLHVELIYREWRVSQRTLTLPEIISNVFAWFALGNFYIAFVVLTVGFSEGGFG